MPCGRVAAAHLLIVAIEEYQLDGNAFLALQTVDRGEAGLDAEVAGSHVDADGQLLAHLRGIGRIPPQQPSQQPKWQVVDTLETEILERLQSGRLSGARHTGDQQDAVSPCLWRGRRGRWSLVARRRGAAFD